MSGWIKIHREISEHWIFQDADKFKWWIDMLFLASYEDNRTNVGNRIVEVKRGQFIGSLSFFMKRWGVTKERVINYLRLLQSDGMIDKKSDNNITFITICNYESYQNLPDNLPDSNPDNKADNLPDNLPDTTKEGKEVKELYINNSNACTCEDGVGWDGARERGFVERFKAQGTAKQMMTITGKNLAEITKLLEIYLANRQMSDIGHKDFSHFCEAFKQAILKGKIKIPTAPQPQEQSQPPQKKVVSSKDIRQQMREMGWEDS